MRGQESKDTTVKWGQACEVVERGCGGGVSPDSYPTATHNII